MITAYKNCITHALSPSTLLCIWDMHASVFIRPFLGKPSMIRVAIYGTCSSGTSILVQ